MDETGKIELEISSRIRKVSALHGILNNYLSNRKEVDKETNEIYESVLVPMLSTGVNHAC